MARGSITKANMLLLRGGKRTKSLLSKSSGTTQPEPAAESSRGVSKSGGKIEDSACWVPHPRTGIYFPKGRERVLDDVPDGAARFSQTHWFRNVDDGVDNPITELLADNNIPINGYQ